MKLIATAIFPSKAMNRIVPDLPFTDYVATPGINATALKIVHQQSLAHAKAYMDGTYKKESAALDFGRAFHSLALEGQEAFEVRPATYDHPKDGVKPWNANAAVCKEWLAAHDGAYIISSAERSALEAMDGAVRPYLNFPDGGQSEVSVFAERDGVPIKARIDFLPAGDDQPVIDLKTCRNAHPEAFMREALRLGYHIQAAFTLSILRKVGIVRSEFRFVAVETEPPFATTEICFGDQDLSVLRMGRRRGNAAFARIVEAMRTNRWPSYGKSLAEDFVPPWMLPELEQTAA